LQARNRVRVASFSCQLRPLAIADLAGALQYSLPENAELDAAGILRRSADSREIVHKVDIDALSFDF
jgi:hypothetical protein